MQRYSIITKKNPREIVLLKSFPCPWEKCSFCDYIHDNTTNLSKMLTINREILSKVTGIYKKLEVINSASVTTIPIETLKEIRHIAKEKEIKTLYFEILYIEKNRIQEIRDFFCDFDVKFKCGIETFDEEFRNDILRKEFHVQDYEEAGRIFSNICLLFGIKGQSRAMIDKDIEIGLKYFDNLCINLFTPNSTKIEQDRDLIEYFKNTYEYLDEKENVEILYNNTDFGVGE